MSRFPITAKLNPLRASNLPYLATSAIIARLGVAAIRVNENKPSKNDNPELTQNEKRQALIERFFVEGMGTFVFTVLPLHFGQDVMNHVLEKTNKALQIPQLNEKHNALSGTERETINQAILKVFGTQKKGQPGFSRDSSGLISRMLFSKSITLADGKTESVRASLSSLRKELGDDLYGKTMKHLPEMTKFSMSLNRYGCLSLLAGVACSAFMGGVFTQRMNDGVVAPAAQRWLTKHYPDAPTTLATNDDQKAGGKKKADAPHADASAKAHAELPISAHRIPIPKEYTVTPSTLSMPDSASSAEPTTAFSGAAYTAMRRQNA